MFLLAAESEFDIRFSPSRLEFFFLYRSVISLAFQHGSLKTATFDIIVEPSYVLFESQYKLSLGSLFIGENRIILSEDSQVMELFHDSVDKSYSSIFIDFLCSC